MSGKREKRFRRLDARVESLERWVDGDLIRARDDYIKAARAARRREREARNREYLWRAVALAAVLAALIVAVLAAVAVRGAEPEEPEPAAVVCQWIRTEQ